MGRMGGAMVGTLRRNGFDVVAWNRDRGKCDAVASVSGAKVAESAAAAAAAADVMLTSLADDAAVEAVYAEAKEGIHVGQVVLEMSTIAPQTVRAIEPAVRERGGEQSTISLDDLLIRSGELAAEADPA